MPDFAESWECWHILSGFLIFLFLNPQSLVAIEQSSNLNPNILKFVQVY